MTMITKKKHSTMFRSASTLAAIIRGRPVSCPPDCRMRSAAGKLSPMAMTAGMNGQNGMNEIRERTNDQVASDSVRGAVGWAGAWCQDGCGDWLRVFQSAGTGAWDGGGNG